MAWLQNTIIWNSIVVSLLGMLVYSMGRTRYFQCRPALVHFLWLVVLAKLITPSLIPVPVSLWGGDATVTIPTTFIEPVTIGSSSDAEMRLDLSREVSGTTSTAFLAEARETIRPAVPAPLKGNRFPDLKILLFPLFLLGSLSGTVAILLWWRIRTRRTIGSLKTLAVRNEMLTVMARDLASQMHRPVNVSVSTVEAAVPPFLWIGAHGSEIYLPAEVSRKMNSDQLDCILRHELAHYFRRDHWSNGFAFMVTAFCWWHPVAWLAVGQLRQLQEISCDAEVVSCSTGKRRLYAETLLQVLEMIGPRPAPSPSLASSFGHSAFVNRRFKMLASTRLQPRSSRLAIVSLSLAALSLLCFPVRGTEPVVETPFVASSTVKVQAGAGLRVAVPASAGEKPAFPAQFTGVKPESPKPVAASPSASPEKSDSREEGFFGEEEVTESSLQERSRKNLEKLFGALQKYNSEHQHFPTPVIWGKDGTGKYPHSWRVAILPYLGEEVLYREYDFDQAWDSPQNRTVLALMPEVFRSPKYKPTDFSTKSAYYVFVERVLNQVEGSSIFQCNRSLPPSLEQLKPLTPFCARNGITIPEITDGLSNTIAIVETAASIPWTKPMDVPFTEKGELPYLGAIHEEGISVVTFDGHVYLIPYLIKPEAFQSLIRHADGKPPIDLSNLQASSFDPAEIWIKGYEIKQGVGGGTVKPDLEIAVHKILNQIDPNSWKLNNPDGIGQIGIDREGNRIVVRHTVAVHEKLKHRFRDAGW